MIAHTRSVSSGPQRTQRGFTLIEVLISVMIMGLVFVAVLGGIFTSIVVTYDNRQRAEADKHGRILAERIKGVYSPYEYKQCATPADYPDLAPAEFSGWRVTVLSVEYWVDPGSGPPSNTFSSTCVKTGLPPLDVDSGMQRITIRAQTPVDSFRQTTQTLVVLKRDKTNDCYKTVARPPIPPGVPDPLENDCP